MAKHPAQPARTSPAIDAPRVFERLSARLLDAYPGDERGRMLHAAGLKTAGRFYAFTSPHDIVVKLPAARVTELIASGAGRPCDPRGGRPMTQWARLTATDERALAAHLSEARDFVAGQQPVRAREPDVDTPPREELP